MADDGQMSEVALWFRRYGSMDYELYDSEDEAANAAVGMVDANTAAPCGIQFPDGRLIDSDEWPALGAAEERVRRWESELAARKPEPRPQRKIRAPFGGGEVEIDVGAPQWLGESQGT